jgi:leader peptidase (prepilin peptidase) / N-methyltransferase
MPVVALAVTGAVLGIVADRIAARWPAHEAGLVRPRDWRTLVLAATGAVAFGALAARWAVGPELALLFPYFCLLLLMMATDLDQRLLPDVLTLPLIPYALVLVLTGLDPLIQGKELGVASAIAAAIAAPVFLVVTNAILKGGLGGGDVKLSIGLGLMSGISRLFTGFVIASAASSLVLVAMLLSRRLTLKTAIPFGPVLIAAGMLAAVLP